MKDAKRMDVEGGRVVLRERRTRKLAVVVAVQNVLVVACLLVTLYVYWGVHTQNSEGIIHIMFDRISGNSGNATLIFNRPESIHGMTVINNKIYINCTGPYILYMDVCYKSLDKKETTGILQLQVEGRTTPATNFTLQVSDEVCRGLQSTVYLKAKDQASLHLRANMGFKINTATLGLHYLLGKQCYS